MSIVIRCLLVAIGLACAAMVIASLAAGGGFVLGWLTGAIVAAIALAFESALDTRRQELAAREREVEMLAEAAEACVADLAEANELIARSLRTVHDLKAAFA